MKKKFIAGFLAASLFVESFFNLGNSAIADAMSTTYQGSAIDMTSKAGEKGDSRKTESKKGLDDSDKSSTVETVPEGYTAVRTIDDLCAINND